MRVRRVSVHGFCLVALAWLVALAPPALAAVAVEGVRLWRAPDNTRVVFDLSGPVSHRSFSLEDPRRLVIDMEEAKLAADTGQLSLDETPIEALRTGVRDDGNLRIVFDLSREVDPDTFVLAEHGEKSDRLVVDFSDLEASEPATEVDPTSQRRDVLVAIDAGHGGEDPGAVGVDGVYEKHVVLDISRKLAAAVNETRGYRAELIREGDYAIALQERRDTARRMRADLFVSVHADAFKHRGAHGASVFALNPNGQRATSETARYLAERENEADLIGGVGSVSLSDKDEMLAGMLLDLSMTATLSSSLEIGDRVLQSMDGVTRLHKSQVEQADFAVLRSPDMPSLLVEAGFISNPDEARRLNSENYRRDMAARIFSGIRDYFRDSPPPGTYLAWRKHNGEEELEEHIIVRGETLSDIAENYDVSVGELLSVNGLSDTAIRVGQRLKIPAS